MITWNELRHLRNTVYSLRADEDAQAAVQDQVFDLLDAEEIRVRNTATGREGRLDGFMGNGQARVWDGTNVGFHADFDDLEQVTA